MSNLKFSTAELAAFREEYCKGATDTQFTVFISECERRGLVPGQHVVFQLRTSKEYDPIVNASVFVKKMVKITTIDALRLVSQRTGEYEGQGEGEFYYLDDNNAPTIMSKIPLPHPSLPQTPREPWAAAIPIYRKGFREPVKVIARFDAYAVLRKDKDSKWTLNEVWARRGPEMLLKCSEAAARRATFPEELAGLYLQEEFSKDEESVPTATHEPAPLLPAPTAPIVPTVNQTPAEGVEAPRPNEEKLPTLVEIVLNKTPEEAPTPKTETSEVPTKPKASRKKAEKIPVSGNQEPIKQPHDREDLGITDEDIANAGKPFTGETYEEAETRKAEAMAFAEDVGSATPVPDRLPTQEQKDGFITRVRELVETHSLNNGSLGKFFLDKTKKTKSADMTVGDWESVFTEIDAAVAAGTLKELVK